MDSVSVAMRAVRAFDHAAHFADIAPVVRTGPVHLPRRHIHVMPNGKFCGEGRATLQLCDTAGRQRDERRASVEFSGRVDGDVGEVHCVIYDDGDEN